MVKEVRVYVEGGGNTNTSRRKIRAGFKTFLDRGGRISRLNVIVCGPRKEAFDNFKRGCRTHPEACNVLLVDSEAPVSRPAWEHLHGQDGWSRPREARQTQCHLMVQAVEAWIISDPDALSAFYGQGFLRKAIPKAEDVEGVDKRRLLSALEHATRETQKGSYHKIDHGAVLLERIDPGKVRARSRHCDLLFRELESVILEGG